MKENRKVIKGLLIILILSFILAIALEWKWYQLFIKIMIGHTNFVINILLGIFASSVLALIIAVITYIIKRKELLNDYYILVGKHIQNINFFGREITSVKREDSVAIHLQRMVPKIKELQFAYNDIVLLHSKLSFFKKDIKISSCVSNINKLTGKLHLKLAPIQYVAAGWVPPKGDESIWFSALKPDCDDFVELQREYSNLQSLLGIHVSVTTDYNDENIRTN